MKNDDQEDLMHILGISGMDNVFKNTNIMESILGNATIIDTFAVYQCLSPNLLTY